MHLNFTNLTMDVIGDAGFGTDFDAQANPDNHVSKSIKVWIEAAAKIGPAVFLPFWDKLPIKAIQDFFHGQNLLTNILTKVITSRTDDPNLSRPDLLQSLVELKYKSSLRPL